MRRIVTEWFRVPRVWPHVARHLASLGRPVTVWSGGCGTGQEAYSAAILLAERGIPGCVVATDIDADLLAVAERGEYQARDVHLDVDERRLTAAQVARYFVRSRGRYTVRTEIRERVSFAQGTLGADRPPACDVAFVRNVWRHIDAQAQRRLARQIHAALPAEGLLLLGGGDLMDPATMTDIEPAGLSRYFVEAEQHELIWLPRRNR